VPVATNTPINEAAPGVTDPFSVGFCRLLGNNLPFADADLATLYRDLGDYVDRYSAATDAVLAQGFITPEGADRLKAEAAEYPRLRPTQPTVERAGPARARPKSDKLCVTWFGSTAADTTFELQHRGRGGDWSGVAGAAALTDPSFKLKKERREGTYRYRVKSSTDVPPQTYRALSGQVLSTGHSRASKKVKIDRTGPRKPRVKLIGTREDGAFVGKVRIRVKGRGDPKLRDGSRGSGVDRGFKPKVKVIEGKGKNRNRFKVKAWTKDNAGNRSELGVRRFEIA
jgi:hypothetical protein